MCYIPSLKTLSLGLSPREIPRSSHASPRKTPSIPPLLLGLPQYLHYQKVRVVLSRTNIEITALKDDVSISASVGNWAKVQFTNLVNKVYKIWLIFCLTKTKLTKSITNFSHPKPRPPSPHNFFKLTQSSKPKPENLLSQIYEINKGFPCA